MTNLEAGLFPAMRYVADWRTGHIILKHIKRISFPPFDTCSR